MISNGFLKIQLLIFSLQLVAGLHAQVPQGFKSIFNGKNMDGWHISRTSHQGTTPGFKVEGGVIIVNQNPFGQGGVLLSDRSYENFELYMEVKLDSFSNGGIFIRSSESGMAYQIEMDESQGSTGSLYGERMPVSTTAAAGNRAAVWRANDWNSFRIRMVGDIPHITLWINEVQMWDVRQSKNDFVAGATQGMVGLQCHWTALYAASAGEWNGLNSWAPGAVHRYRNIAIRKLKNKLRD